MNSPKSGSLPPMDDESVNEFELICDALAPSALGADWCQRLLDSVGHAGRFDRFAASAAELLGIEPQLAQEYLSWLGESQRWLPGFLPQMSLIHLELGLSIVPAMAGFVRLLSGSVFPEHEHLGQESILIIQGSCEDAGRIVRSGERLTMPAGSSHSFVVRPGPDLVYLAVVQKGLRIGGREILADHAASGI